MLAPNTSSDYINRLNRADVRAVIRLTGADTDAEAISEALTTFLASRMSADGIVDDKKTVEEVLAEAVGEKLEIRERDIRSKAGDQDVAQAVRTVRFKNGEEFCEVVLRFDDNDEASDVMAGGRITWTDPDTMIALVAEPVQMYVDPQVEGANLIRFNVIHNGW